MLLLIIITNITKEDLKVIQRRFSKQRQIIYDMIKNNPVHPTADHIYNTLKQDYPDLSLGTVYRNLNVLTESGLILKITSDSKNKILFNDFLK